MPPWTYEERPGRQEAGTTIFRGFPGHTAYFGDRSRQWMINFRVRDLDTLVAHLREE